MSLLIDEERPLTDPRSIAVSSVSLVVGLCLIKVLSRNPAVARIAQRVSVVHNRSYSLMSAALALVLLFPRSMVPALDQGYAYHLSKFYEYLDLIFFRLAGRRIPWGFAVHHLTTPYWTYLRCISGPRGDSWKAFGVLNALHHAMMYANFGGIKRFKPVLKYSQSAQLGVGLGVETWCIIRSNGGLGDIAPHVVAGCLLLVYAAFFIKEYLAGDYDTVATEEFRVKKK